MKYFLFNVYVPTQLRELGRYSVYLLSHLIISILIKMVGTVIPSLPFITKIYLVLGRYTIISRQLYYKSKNFLLSKPFVGM